MDWLWICFSLSELEKKERGVILLFTIVTRGTPTDLLDVYNEDVNKIKYLNQIETHFKYTVNLSRTLLDKLEMSPFFCLIPTLWSSRHFHFLFLRTHCKQFFCFVAWESLSLSLFEDNFFCFFLWGSHVKHFSHFSSPPLVLLYQCSNWISQLKCFFYSPALTRSFKFPLFSKCLLFFCETPSLLNMHLNMHSNSPPCHQVGEDKR